MRSLSTRLRSVLAGAFLLASASATDYYVDAVWGLDANPGTAPAPWRTLKHACAQALAPGDSLRIRGVFTAPSERFPLRLPPCVGLTAYSPFGTALIDAGGEAALVFDRAGVYEQTIGIDPFQYSLLTIAGAPALELRNFDRDTVLRPS